MIIDVVLKLVANWRVLLCALLVAGAYWAGRDGAQRECAAADAARKVAAGEAWKQATNDINGVASELRAAIDQARDDVRVIKVQVEKETQRVEYRCPVPDSGLELYNRAARGVRP